MKSLQHFYGTVTEIERNSIVTMDNVHWFEVAPSASESIKKIQAGDTVFIALEAWAISDIADIYVFRRDTAGARVLREVTSLHIGNQCRLGGTLESLSLGLKI